MLDIVIVIVVSLGFYVGYSRGLLKTLFDSLSLVIGIVAALKLSPITINLLQGLLKLSPGITFILGVIITFIGVLALVRLLGKKIEHLLEAININFVNKLAGGTLQALFFAYLLSLSFWLLTAINVLSPEVRQSSLTYSLLEPLPAKGKRIFEAMKPLFKGFWDKTLEAMDTIKDKSDQSQSQ